MFEQNIYRMVDQNNGKEIKQILDTENNKVIWERAIPTYDTPIVPTRNAPLLEVSIDGVCTQDGTPMPDAPVDIVCNNGALRMVDDELPVGYKRVLGFTLNNNAYWEIEDFPLYGSDTLRFAFEATDACNVIGAYSGSASGNNYSLYVGSSSNYLRYKNVAYNSSVSYNTRYDVEITPTGTSGMKTDSTWTEQTFTTPNNLCIGTTSARASSANLKGNLYGNIEVVGRAKFVPCERLSDNALGYYDLVGKVFYEQASSYNGAVSLGYDGSHYSLSVVGTPEVLTVGGNGVEAICFVYWDSPANGITVRLYYGTEDQSEYGAIPVVVGEEKSVVVTQIKGNTSDSVANAIAEQLSYDEVVTMYEGGFDGENYEIVLYLNRQTATVPDLYAVGDYKDEVDIVSGTVARRVGVKVLDGTEADWLANSANGIWMLRLWDKRIGSAMALTSTHFTGTNAGTASMPDNSIKFYNSTAFNYNGTVFIKATAYSTLDDFKSYLAAQYAAGTPVIVIYPLVEETTESIAPRILQGYRGKIMIVTAQSQYVSGQNIEVKYLGIDSGAISGEMEVPGGDLP